MADTENLLEVNTSKKTVETQTIGLDSPTFHPPSKFYEDIENSRTHLRLFVPGRVCLFGEHSDWAGGYRNVNQNILPGRCLVSGTNQGLYAKVYQHTGEFHMRSVDQHGTCLGSFSCPMDIESLLAIAETGNMFSYAAGVAYNILVKYNVGGLVIDNYMTTLPVKKGLSSSAAICVLVARAFNRVYNLKLTIQGEMDLAYLGERTTPSKCGRMDQCCAYGNRPVLTTFDADRVTCKEIAVGCELHLVLVDLCAAKDTKIILRELNAPYLMKNPDAKGMSLIELLGPINHDITEQAIEAIESGNVAQVGELMTEAMVEFDNRAQPVCPSQLTAPVLHQCMSYEALQPLMYGCKGCGAGGDGTCQILAKSKEAAEEIVRIVEGELGMQGLTLTIGKSTQIRRAVIPTASYSHQMFPATKAISNALFPVVDPDGIAKPFITLLVEEALDAGIDEVILVVSHHDELAFRDLFQEPIPKNRYQHLSPKQQKYAKKLLEMAERVSFVVQEHQEGLGHAIYQARELINNEPFLLMLGDHLYMKNGNAPSCVQQILDHYDGNNLVGLRPVTVEEVNKYGIVTGDWTDEHTLAISEMVEKPDRSYAEENLMTDEKYLAFFGLYCLDGERVMQKLGDNINANIRSENGGFGLTSVLSEMLGDSSVNGYFIDGNCLDIGNPRTYIQTLLQYSNNDSTIICK